MGDFTRIFIQDWREKFELSQTELAELLDLTIEDLAEIESHNAPYTPEMIHRLARIFDIDAYRLFTHPAVSFERDGLRDALTPEALSALLRIYLPDTVATLKERGKIDDMINDQLSDDYWDVQGNKLLSLMEFLKSYKDDPSATLRSLFEAL